MILVQMTLKWSNRIQGPQQEDHFWLLAQFFKDRENATQKEQPNNTSSQWEWQLSKGLEATRVADDATGEKKITD